LRWLNAARPFVMLVDTGIRPGETAGMKWEDLDGPALRVRCAPQVKKSRSKGDMSASAGQTQSCLSD